MHKVVMGWALSLLLIGCSGSGVDDAAEGGIAPVCQAFESDSMRVRARGETVLFSGQRNEGGQVDLVVVEMIGQSGGPRAVGTYEIDGTKNYKNCVLCVLVATGCEQQPCDTQYYATSGTVTIDEYATREGQRAAVTLTNVQLVEVTIAQDYTSTPVPNGEQLCLSSASISGAVELVSEGTSIQTVDAYSDTSDTCVSDGNGTGLGHNIANAVFQTCDGGTVDLHALYCGQGEKAVWLATSAEWCAPCKAVDPIFHELAMQNEAIDFFVLLGQDSGGGTDFLEAECANGFGHATSQRSAVPASHVLIDPNWTISDGVMSNYDAAGIPYGRVIAGNNMHYIWSQFGNDGVIVSEESALQEASGLDDIAGWSELEDALNNL